MLLLLAWYWMVITETLRSGSLGWVMYNILYIVGMSSDIGSIYWPHSCSTSLFTLTKACHQILLMSPWGTKLSIVGPRAVTHACNISTLENEAEELWVWVHSELHIRPCLESKQITASQNDKRKDYYCLNSRQEWHRLKLGNWVMLGYLKGF